MNKQEGHHGILMGAGRWLQPGVGTGGSNPFILLQKMTNTMGNQKIVVFK